MNFDGSPLSYLLGLAIWVAASLTLGGIYCGLVGLGHKLRYRRDMRRRVEKVDREINRG